MELIELMCDSCHEFFEVTESQYNKMDRPLCFDCTNAICEE